MRIKTFYWHDRVLSHFQYFRRRIFEGQSHLYFRVGNAGDIFTREILRYRYGLKSCNVRVEGGRILCVGSIAHCIMPGDVLCGVGFKGGELPSFDEAPCVIYGVRGPITYDAFKKAGHDMSQLRFMRDPGLMLRFLVDGGVSTPRKNKVIFIPHYRERNLYDRLPRGISFVDIDSEPLKLAKMISAAELVYSSSLHGIIFAHALNRPCVFVRPQTDEPLLKFEDYFMSVGIKYEKPLDSIYEFDYLTSPNSPPDLNYGLEEFYFPSADYLTDNGIIVK